MPEIITKHLLTWITFLPLAGALYILVVPKKEALNHMRVAALIATLPSFLLGIYMLCVYDPAMTETVAAGVAYGTNIQFVEKVPWIPTFHVDYFVGVDGLSVPLVILTVLLCPLCVLASWGITDRLRGYLPLFLLLETGMLGVFVALDFFLFYVFWEVMLLPMYFLIGIWGGPRKEYAAIKFFLYTLFGSVFLLIAMIACYLATGGGADSFNLLTLGQDLVGQSARFKYWIFVAMYIGFAIKIPAFPFHTWLPDAHVQAPTAISVILAGVLLKMGIYGIIRICYPLLPEAAVQFAPILATLAVINIVYGALCAMAQTDIKSLVAYSSISHMGFVMLGLAACTEEGLNGAMLQTFNHGTIAAMLFLLVGVVYDRAHHRNIDGFGGLAKVAPIYSGIVMLAFFANLGLPTLSGFIGEALVFLGAFGVFPVRTIISATGVIITAAYMLWAFQRMFMGPVNEKYKDLPEITPREICTLAPLGAIVIFLGVYPMPLINLFNVTVDQVKVLFDVAASATGA